MKLSGAGWWVGARCSAVQCTAGGFTRSSSAWWIGELLRLMPLRITHRVMSWQHYSPPALAPARTRLDYWSLEIEVRRGERGEVINTGQRQPCVMTDEMFI